MSSTSLKEADKEDEEEKKQRPPKEQYTPTPPISNPQFQPNIRGNIFMYLSLCAECWTFVG